MGDSTRASAEATDRVLVSCCFMYSPAAWEINAQGIFQSVMDMYSMPGTLLYTSMPMAPALAALRSFCS